MLSHVYRYDVNVTPDKRKVFIQEEAQLLASLQQVGCMIKSVPSEPLPRVSNQKDELYCK